MKYISAQNDTPYFHWQLEVQLHNFAKIKIPKEDYYILLAYKSEPSKWAKEMKQKGYQIYSFKDERIETGYIPSIRPTLLMAFFAHILVNDIDLGEQLFYLDSDVVFNRLPNYAILEPNTTYVSDCKSYIGYKYLNKISPELLYLLAEIANVGVNTIYKNRNHAGGAQYIFQSKEFQTPWFWQNIEFTCNEIYKECLEWNVKHKDNQVQAWTADMWALLWNCYKHTNVEITPELDFVWATDRVEACNYKPILHLAGVTEELKYTHFFKGDYINQSPIEEIRRNPFAFDYVCGNATQKYVQLIAEIAYEKAK